MTTRQQKAFRPIGRVLVAVDFDARLDGVISAAEVVARRLGADLRIAHVCDPWARSHLAAAVDSGTPEQLGAVRAEARRVAQRRLEALRRSLPAPLAVETAVLEGDVARALVGDAAESDCGLIVIGATRGGAAGTATGFSTAVSVIGESTVPVLVLCDDARLDATRSDWRVLVADDDSPVAAAALALGSQLVATAAGGSLLHLRVGELLATSEPGKPSASAPERRVADIEAALVKRAGELATAIERAGGRYEAEAVLGSVPDEVARSAAAARVDLAVFGQHRAYHRRPMHAGHMPYRAMLSLGRAVIVVPEEA